MKFDIDKILQAAEKEKNKPPTETKWSKKLCERLRKRGVVVHRFVGGYRQKSGIPDSWIGFGGMSVWIEFKGHKTKLEPHQRACIKTMRAAGSNVYIYRWPNRLEDEDGNLICISEEKDLLMDLHKLCGEEHAFWAEAAKYYASICNEGIKEKCKDLKVVNEKGEVIDTAWQFMLPMLQEIYVKLQARSK